jgi:chromosome segregation ATPase
VQVGDVRLVADLAGQKNEHLQRELSVATDTARERSAQLADANRSLSIHQLQSAASSTTDQLLVDNRRLHTRVGELEEEVRRWAADFDPVLRYLAVDQGVHRTQSSVAGEERTHILDILQARDRSLSSLESENERLRQELLRRESIQVSQDMAVASLRQEFLSCQAMCQRQAAQVTQLEADRHLLQQRASLTHGDADQAQLQVHTLQTTLTQTVDFLSAARRDVTVLTGQVQQAKERQAAAENSLATHRQQADQLQRRQLSGHQDLQSVLLERAELENRLQEYKLLLSNTDAGSRAHSQQMEAMSARLRSGEQSEQRLEREVATLKTVLVDREASILTLQRNLEGLDAERDRLQELLDCADERDSQTGVVTRQLEAGGAQLQQVVQQLEKKLSVSAKELVHAHRQSAVIEARLNAVQNDLVSLGRRYQESQSEVDSAAKDLQLMTRENQALTSELASVSAEKERLKARVGELMQSLAGTQQSFRALEMEKNDLLETYRSVIQDKRRVEGDLGAMR